MTYNSMIDTNGNLAMPKGGRFFQNELSSNRYTVRNQIDFDKSWKNHAVTAIAGLEFRENKIPKPTRQLMYGYDPQTLTSDIIDWQAYRDGVGTSALSGKNHAIVMHLFMPMQAILICPVIMYPEVSAGIRRTCSDLISVTSVIPCGLSVRPGLCRKSHL